VASLESSIRTTAIGLLEPLLERGGGDFVKEFSGVLPAEVIFALLGVPEADRTEAREWMDVALDRDPDTPELPSRAIEAMMQLARYWYELVRDLRRHPNEGLVSALLDVEIETEDGSSTRLSEGELVGLCSVLAGGGNETTTRLLANAAVLFAKDDDSYRKVLAEPGRIPAAVEEVLRYSSPAQYAARTVTRDVEWYGTKVPSGDRIVLFIGAANRDEREYPDPDRFDIERPIPNQLAFGEGVHFCVGAPLARLESRVALEEFTKRFPRYDVDEARCTRIHMSNVHGYASVPFTRA
jgi:hypothetical protein